MNTLKRKPIVAATLIIALLLAVAMFGVMFLAQTSPIQAAAFSPDDRHPPTQSISARQAFADHDFDYSTINIVLTPTASRQFLDYSVCDFSEISAVQITDLTAHTVSHVQQSFEFQNSSNAFRQINDSGYEVLVDADAFQRILSLTIENGSRECIYYKIDLLNQRCDVYIAEPNFKFTVNNAPAFTGDWTAAMRNIIGYDALESFQANAPAINVGIIDSGINSVHAQLNARIHRSNPHNAQTTWHRSWIRNAAGQAIITENVIDPADLMAFGHGTQSAGIVAAMHWNARLVCLRVFNANGQTWADQIAAAIDYARGRGIPVLNYSGSGYGTAAAVANSLNQFTGLFVTSAGNGGRNRDTDTQWGNAATQTRTIVVGAHNHNGDRSVWNPDPRRVDQWGWTAHQSSSFGANRVHIYAPGGMGMLQNNNNIWAPAPGAVGFNFYSGTSAAAPFVAGTAALIRSINPNLSAADVRTVILNNTESQNITVPVWDAAGNNIINHVPATVQRLNAHKAVSATVFTTAPTTGGMSITGIRPGFTLQNNTHLRIPERFNPGNGMHTVNTIGNSAFANQTQLSQITIPATVTYIGSSAFRGCTNLVGVDFLDGNITNVPNHRASFVNHFYTQIPLNARLIAGVTYTLSFDFSNLQATVPLNQVFTSLGVGENIFAFDIFHSHFGNTSSGRQVIQFTPTAEQLATSNNLWVRLIRTGSRQTVSADISNIRLDSQSQLQRIRFDAFRDTTSLRSIDLPSTVWRIGGNAFRNSGLTSIVLPNGLREVGHDAFRYNTSLVSVQMNGVTYVGENAFRGATSLASVSMNSVERIRAGAFRYTSSLTSVTLPNTLWRIGANAFRGSGLTSIIIPASVESISYNAFMNSVNLQEVRVRRPSSQGITTLGENAFTGTAIANIFVPNTASVTAYRAAQNWSRHSSIIRVG